MNEVKFKVGDCLTDGKRDFLVLSWDYGHYGAYYNLKTKTTEFSWLAKEVDEKLKLKKEIIMNNPIDYWYKKYLEEKEKNAKMKKLGDAMYYAAQQMSTDASHLTKAMKEWWNFKNYELVEE